MVNRINNNFKEDYYCEECELVYNSLHWAKKCEEWCKKNNSCNLKITGNSIKKVLKDFYNFSKSERFVYPFAHITEIKRLKE